jgi:hypothetical protein
LVEDAEAAVARADELGAAIFRPPFDVLDAGRVPGTNRGAERRSQELNRLQMVLRGLDVQRERRDSNPRPPA